MKWKEFLNHSEITQFGQNPPPGKYLFGIVLHDSLDCLNKFISCAKLISSMQTAPVDVQKWFSKWLPKANNWLISLSDSWKLYHEDDPSDLIWEKLIRKTGKTLEDTSEMVLESQEIELPDEEDARFVVEEAIRNAKLLDSMCFDIQSQEYFRLWNRISRKTPD